MSRRSRAREVVMQLLYRDDLNGIADSASDNQFLATRLNRNAKLIEFADTILQGVRQKIEAIDQSLESTTQNWRLSRMAATDRNIMRIAAWEILFGKTPHRVAINEAIEMSKRYGDENSSRFVNGVLDKLMQNARNPNTNNSVDPAVEVASPETSPKTSDDATPKN